MSESSERRGEAILRVVPQPADINSNGHIFGGWVLSQMDIAGGIVAGQIADGRCATVAIETMQFHAPILVRDIISVYATVERGREEVKVTSGVFTFVALDDDFRPRPLPLPE
jgi:acyl-CoA thioesterase YciA